MSGEEWRGAAGERGEEDPRETFEKVDRAVREEQSPQIGEEGTEEDRRQWEKTRDLHEEAKKISERTDARHREGRKDPGG